MERFKYIHEKKGEEIKKRNPFQEVAKSKLPNVKV
jgi:hypothetical protein